MLDDNIRARYKTILGQANPVQVSPVRPTFSNNPTPADKELSDQPPHSHDPLAPAKPLKPIVSNFPTPVDEVDGTEVNPTNTLTPKKPLKPIVSNFPTPIDEIGANEVNPTNTLTPKKPLKPIVSNFPTPIDEIGPSKSDKFKPIAKVPGDPIHTQPVEPIAPLTIDGEGTISHNPLPASGTKKLDHGYTLDTKGLIKNAKGSTVGILTKDGGLVDHAGKALPATSQKELRKLFSSISKSAESAGTTKAAGKNGLSYKVENGILKLNSTGRGKHADTTRGLVDNPISGWTVDPKTGVATHGTVGYSRPLPKPIVSNFPTPAGSAMCAAPESLSRAEFQKYKCADVLMPPMPKPPKSPPIFGETVTLPPAGYILQATNPRLWMDEHGIIRDANNGIVGIQCVDCDNGTWLDPQEQPVSTDTAQEWYNLFRNLKPTKAFAYVPPKSPPVTTEPVEPVDEAPTTKLPTLQSLGYHLMEDGQRLYVGRGVFFNRDDDGQPGMLFHHPELDSQYTIRVLDNGGVIIKGGPAQVAPTPPVEEIPYVPLPTK